MDCKQSPHTRQHSSQPPEVEPGAPLSNFEQFETDPTLALNCYFPAHPALHRLEMCIFTQLGSSCKDHLQPA